MTLHQLLLLMLLLSAAPARAQRQPAAVPEQASTQASTAGTQGLASTRGDWSIQRPLRFCMASTHNFGMSCKGSAVPSLAPDGGWQCSGDDTFCGYDYSVWQYAPSPGPHVLTSRCCAQMWRHFWLCVCDAWALCTTWQLRVRAMGCTCSGSLLRNLEGCICCESPLCNLARRTRMQTAHAHLRHAAHNTAELSGSACAQRGR